MADTDNATAAAAAGSGLTDRQIDSLFGRLDDLLGKVDRLAAAQDALASRIDALTAPAGPRIEGTASGLSAVPIPPAPDGPLFNLDAVGELG